MTANYLFMNRERERQKKTKKESDVRPQNLIKREREKERDIMKNI